MIKSSTDNYRKCSAECLVIDVCLHMASSLLRNASRTEGEKRPYSWTNSTVISIYVITPLLFVAFVRERFHNAVEIDILGIFEVIFIVTNLPFPPPPPPKNYSGAKFFRGRMT